MMASLSDEFVNYVANNVDFGDTPKNGSILLSTSKCLLDTLTCINADTDPNIIWDEIILKSPIGVTLREWLIGELKKEPNMIDSIILLMMLLTNILKISEGEWSERMGLVVA